MEIFCIVLIIKFQILSVIMNKVLVILIIISHVKAKMNKILVKEFSELNILTVTISNIS